MKKKIFRMILIFGFLGIAPLLSCGGSSSTSDSDSPGDSSSSDFEVSGTLAQLTVSNLSPSDVDLNTSGTVSHVLAVSPETGGTSCKSGTVDSKGTFSLRLTGRKPWFLFFIDRLRRGSQMFLGRFRFSTLDTLTPNKTSGNASLGNVTIDSSEETASASTSTNDLISSLGLDTSTADTLGAMDDVATRYANPDADDDGEMDCGNSNKQFMFDFHVRFDMDINGTRARVSDMIDQFFSSTATVATYSSTGIYVAYPSSFSSTDTGSVTFVNSAVTTSEGGLIPANTATSAVTTNSFSSFKGFGPNTTSTSELPSGKILFAFGGKTLTFTKVQTPALSTLTAPTGRIFPFLKLSKSDSSCTTNCTLSGISYQWMKKTSTGWTQASLTEVTLFVASAGGNLSFRVDNNSNKTVQFSIPKTSIEGTLTWNTSNATLSGVTASEFNSLVTSQICHVGLSYDDQLGMRYFENIENASGTCS